MKIFKKLILYVLCLALVSGIAWAVSPNILNEDCADISDWTDGDNGSNSSLVSPAGQFQFVIVVPTGGGKAQRYRVITSPPSKFTVEIRTYFSSLGAMEFTDHFSLTYSTGTWCFRALFGVDGLFITKTGAVNVEVGTNIVKESGTAAWQTWRFQVDKSAGEAAATVEVFLKEEGGAWVSRGVFDCDWEVAQVNGTIALTQYGTLANSLSYVDHVKVAIGLGEIGNIGNQPILIF